MKYYILVEGKVEKIVYKKWIPFVNKNLQFVNFNNMSDAPDGSFVIVSGDGYPYYLSMIENSIYDVNEYNYDHLVLIVDTENVSPEEKLDEIKEYIQRFETKSEINIILQNPCIEAWALGNRKIFKRNPIDPKLKEFITIINVFEQDPELIPAFPKYSYNRATFAYEYLRRILLEKNGSYSKTKPQSITQRYYFDQIHSRYARFNHIQNFKSFLDIFSNNN